MDTTISAAGNGLTDETKYSVFTFIHGCDRLSLYDQHLKKGV